LSVGSMNRHSHRKQLPRLPLPLCPTHTLHGPTTHCHAHTHALPRSHPTPHPLPHHLGDQPVGSRDFCRCTAPTWDGCPYIYLLMPRRGRRCPTHHTHAPSLPIPRGMPRDGLLVRSTHTFARLPPPTPTLHTTHTTHTPHTLHTHTAHATTPYHARAAHTRTHYLWRPAPPRQPPHFLHIPDTMPYQILQVDSKFAGFAWVHGRTDAGCHSTQSHTTSLLKLWDAPLLLLAFRFLPYSASLRGQTAHPTLCGSSCGQAMLNADGAWFLPRRGRWRTGGRQADVLSRGQDLVM